MKIRRDKSFGDLLDELIASETVRPDHAPSPALQIDLLDQIERLQAGNASTFEPAARAVYAEPTLAPEAIEALETLLPDLPTDADTISRELRLDGVGDPVELDRIRRRFAFANHPDRLAPHLRDRAALRMSVANGLIDAAKKKIPVG